jgi:hypothetical protein
MKIPSILLGAALCGALFNLPLNAQSEGGNSGPSGGASGVSGTAGSGAEQGQAGTNGGKNTAGTSKTVAGMTNAPAGGDFHPPTTDPGANQH